MIEDGRALIDVCGHFGVGGWEWGLGIVRDITGTNVPTSILCNKWFWFKRPIVRNDNVFSDIK